MINILLIVVNFIIKLNWLIRILRLILLLINFTNLLNYLLIKFFMIVFKIFLLIIRGQSLSKLIER